MQPLILQHFTTIRKLFFEYGIRYNSMDDIARQLHISKRTIYTEYTSKDELVKDLFLSDYYQLRASLISLDSKKLDAITKTMLIYSITQRRITSISRLVICDLEKYYPALLDELVVLYEELIHQSFVRTLIQGKTDKYFHDEIMPDSIAHIFSFLFKSYALSRISVSTDGFTLCRNEVLDYHFRSICNPIGLDIWATIKEKRIKTTVR